MKLHTAAFIIFAAGLAQAEDSSLPWEGEATLRARSKTAMSITGDATLSGLAHARVMTVETGAKVQLRFVEMVKARWTRAHYSVAGWVYEVVADPGNLKNGNSFCGGHDATFVVFTMDHRAFGMAVFRGEKPTSIKDTALCGTYSYTLD